MRTAIAGLVVMFALPVAPALAQQSSPDAEVGRIGERVITLADVDAAWRDRNPGEQGAAWQAVYDGRRALLDTLIAEALIADAARAKSLTDEAFLEAELSMREEPVEDADMLAFFEQRKGDFKGRTFEQMQPAIREFLEQQHREAAREALVADLRKSGGPVRVSLAPPRYAVNVTSADPVRGNPAAPVTIVEYSDFQCPFCSRVTPSLSKLLAEYGDRVRVIWKDFPLTQIHPRAVAAAEAAHCAGEQDKYWQYHDQLFANQQALAATDLSQYASALDLDVPAFQSCVGSGRYTARVQGGLTEGRDLGVNSTPTVFINGRRVLGAQPYDVFSAIVDEELAIAQGR